jgi:hypothetical protein
MKAVVRDSRAHFTTIYVKHNGSDGRVVTYIEGVEKHLLDVVLQQMNMTFLHVPTPRGIEMEESPVIDDLINGMVGKEIDIVLGGFGTHYLIHSFFDSTNAHYMMRTRWYVPCSVKYPRWSSMFRILSVELWIVLFISIVIATISTTLVGRYSCTSEWQVYKTLVGSSTNILAVILGVSVSTMPRAPSVRSLFLTWVCFSLAFSTAFQAFLTTFLIESGYETPIQNMDELFASGIKLAYPPQYNFIYESGDERELSIVKRNRVNCSSYEVCVDWAKYQKNVSILLDDMYAEVHYAGGDFFGANSEPLVCRLEDGIVFATELSMIMLYGDPLIRRVSVIIDRVVEAGIYNHWISVQTYLIKLRSRKISMVHPLNGYYSFNLYHMQPAFYLLLMGWCISVLCFMIELLYNCILCKRKLT